MTFLQIITRLHAKLAKDWNWTLFHSTLFLARCSWAAPGSTSIDMKIWISKKIAVLTKGALWILYWDMHPKRSFPVKNSANANGIELSTEKEPRTPDESWGISMRDFLPSKTTSKEDISQGVAVAKRSVSATVRCKTILAVFALSELTVAPMKMLTLLSRLVYCPSVQSKEWRLSP